MLERKGLLQRYSSPSARDIPASMKDPDGYWTGFAARARILIYNKDLFKGGHPPTSILDLTKPEWRARVSLAYPLFGTTATHAAALAAYWGVEKTKTYFRELKSNDVLIVDGNASSRDAVARGEVPIGFTDTDDAYIAIEQGKHVGMIFPDQGYNQFGTLVIPNTVALIKNCPHPKQGKKLIDFLLSRETEEMLAFCGSGQIPVRADIKVPDGVHSMQDIKTAPVEWDSVEAKVGETSRFMETLFIR
jgi:iron(III) transport system substrate-binding protein